MEADEHFFRKLQDGYRMEKPKYATKLVYEEMQKCWMTEPTQRPSFCDLEVTLGEQLEASVRRHYIELNDPYVQSNTNRITIAPDYLSMVAPVDYANVGSNPTSHYVNVPTNQIEDDKLVLRLFASFNPIERIHFIDYIQDISYSHHIYYTLFFF